MPLQSSNIQHSPSLPPAAPDLADTQASATTAGSVPLPPGNGGEQTASIAMLPCELLANITGFLSLRHANALASTASPFTSLLATTQCETRATQARTLADFRTLAADVMPAPPTFRRHVVQLLQERIGVLPPAVRHRADALLRGVMFSTIDIEAAVRKVRHARDVSQLVAQAASAPEATRAALAAALWDRIPALDLHAQPGSCSALTHLVNTTASLARDPLWSHRTIELANMADTARFEASKAQQRQHVDDVMAQTMAAWLTDPQGPLGRFIGGPPPDAPGPR